MRRKAMAFFLVILLLLPYTAHAATDSLAASLTVVNSWENGGKHYAQLEGVVQNTSSKTLESWTYSWTIAGITVDQAWNCEYTLSKAGVLKVSNADYNGQLIPQGTASFGLIVASEKPIDLSSGAQTTNAPTPKPTATAAPLPVKTSPPPSTGDSADWLFASGNRIVDAEGDEVWITGLNWFGYNTGTNAFDGLWTANMTKTVAEIANKGFNLIRVPMSTELLLDWSEYRYPEPNINYSANPELEGLHSLEIFDAFLKACAKNGLKVMVDIHSADSDPMGHMDNVWYNDDITTNDYYAALRWIAKRYRKNDTIIAYDLKNEPHGKPGENPRAMWNNTTNRNNWKYIAEKAAGVILKENPHALIVIEGIEIYPKDIQKNGNFASTNANDYYYTWWGANLRGVADYPVDLGKHQNKLIYSPHDYGPSVYKQPWFDKKFTYNTLLKEAWRDNWFYIHEQEIAPLLIGEWGGFLEGDTATWLRYLRRLIRDNRLSHTFWCLNPNSGDTGGLLLDDFTTWDKDKLAFVQEALWKKDGKFVGLDAEVPLGKNGLARP